MRKILLLALTTFVIWFYVDWDKVTNPEYRHLSNYSEQQQEVFEERLLKAMESKSTIYIRDLVDFEWDTVCAMGGYSRLREDLAQKNFYGKDFPELELFPQVDEGSYNFVFFYKNKSIAVINHFKPDIRYSFDTCTKKNSARFKLIDSKTHVPFELIKKHNYQVRWIDLNKYQNCVGLSCHLTFHGDK